MILLLLNCYNYINDYNVNSVSYTHLDVYKRQILLYCDKLDARELTLLHWQDRWNKDDRGRWTGFLISNMKEWIDRQRGEINWRDHKYIYD